MVVRSIYSKYIYTFWHNPLSDIINATKNFLSNNVIYDLWLLYLIFTKVILYFKITLHTKMCVVIVYVLYYNNLKNFLFASYIILDYNTYLGSQERFQVFSRLLSVRIKENTVVISILSLCSVLLWQQLLFSCKLHTDNVTDKGWS